MKKLWNKLPDNIQLLVMGNGIFLISSIVASLSFTDISSFLTVIAAIGTGYFTTHIRGQNEVKTSILSTLVACLFLQILYFSSIGPFIGTGTSLFLLASNTALVGLFSALGGLLAFIMRKHKEKKEEQLKKALLLKENTYWIDRLFLSVALLVYISVFTLPIPVYAKEKQSVDEFFKSYDPEKDYQPGAEAVVPTIPPAYIEQGQGEVIVLEYYNDMEELKGTPLGIADYFVLTFQGVTLGVFKWKEPNRLRREYMEGVYGRTGNVVAQLASGIGWTVKNPKTALQNVKNAGSGALSAFQSLATISSMVQIDQHNYYADAHKKLFAGDFRQLGNILNPFGGITHSLNLRYPGGAKGFVQDTFSPQTAEAIAGIAVSQQTIQLAKQGELRYAMSRGAGEIVGDIITLKVVGKVLKAIPVAGNAIIDMGKALKWGNEFKGGKFTTSNGIKISDTAHMYEQTDMRKISQSSVLKALKEPALIDDVKYDKQGRPSIRFYTENEVVAVNPTNGKVTTVYNFSKKSLEKEKLKFKQNK